MNVPGNPRRDRPTSVGTSPDALLLGALSVAWGVRLVPRTFVLDGGLRVGVDGTDAVDAAPGVLVQCTTGTGQLKSMHRNKVIADAFKLDWLRDAVAPGARTVLALGPAFTRLLAPGAWLPVALESRRVEVVVVDGDGHVRVIDPKS